jgi:RND family efflux transporter MFP subunit
MGERQEIRAQLIPRRYTTVAAEIGARIKRLPVAESEAFRAGDALVEFDCTVQEAQRDKARAELEASQATHRANEQLAKLNSIGQVEFDLSRAGVLRSQAEVGMHEALLAKCRIPAPFNGRVAEQKVREQQFVQPGQALLDVLDDTSLELEFLVPSSWLRWLKPGLPLRVSIDETRRTYPARFTRIGARVDPVSQTVKVAATIEGRHPELIAGMSGRVQASAP